jgi:PIN domain nuclease of toxin-antitoxin system
MTPLLLDTCAAIWLAEAESIAQEATKVLEEAYDGGVNVYVSPITAWEINYGFSDCSKSSIFS